MKTRMTLLLTLILLVAVVSPVLAWDDFPGGSTLPQPALDDKVTPTPDKYDFIDFGEAELLEPVNSWNGIKDTAPDEKEPIPLPEMPQPDPGIPPTIKPVTAPPEPVVKPYMPVLKPSMLVELR